MKNSAVPWRLQITIGRFNQSSDCIWWFPETELPLNHLFYWDVPWNKPSSYWGSSIFGSLHLPCVGQRQVFASGARHVLVPLRHPLARLLTGFQQAQMVQFATLQLGEEWLVGKLPSGKRLHNYGKKQFLVYQLWHTMVIFNVTPEGRRVAREASNACVRPCFLARCDRVYPQFWL